MYRKAALGDGFPLTVAAGPWAVRLYRENFLWRWVGAYGNLASVGGTFYREKFSHGKRWALTVTM